MVDFFSGIGGMQFTVERNLGEIQRTATTSHRLGKNDASALKGRTNKTAQIEPHRLGLRALDLRLSKAYEISINANQTYRGNFLDGDSGRIFDLKTKLVKQLNPSDSMSGV